MFILKGKFFSLIELIVVIVFLGILTSIILVNISSQKEQATVAAVKGNIRNLQTSVDMYTNKNNDRLPTQENPNEFEPQPIDYSVLSPDYSRTIPKTKGFNYWVDFRGIVWGSSVDAPVQVAYKNAVEGEAGTLSWDNVKGAESYHVYEVINSSLLGNGLMKTKLRFIKEVANTDSNEIITEVEGGEHYVISAIDKYGLETAPAGLNYRGYTEETTPESSNPNPSVPNSNKKPNAVIKLNEPIFANFTTIQWSAEASNDPDYRHTIEDIEWEWNGEITTNLPQKLDEGSYVIRLRVKDNIGLWSDWEEKEFNVLNGESVSDVYLGPNTGFAVLENGMVKAWGDNTHGQLGLGYVGGIVTTPTLIPELYGVEKITANATTTHAILKDGSVMAFGENNTNGRLGIGRCLNEKVPNPTKMNIAGVRDIYDNFAVLEDGTVKAWFIYTTGNASCSPKTMMNLKNVEYIIKDVRYGNISFARNEKGVGFVLAWGTKNSGQYPYGIPEGNVGGKSIKQVVSNQYSTYVVYDDGTVKVWGRNYEGQLGLGYRGEDITVPTQIPNLTNVEKIVTENNYAYAILTDKTVKVWGYNYDYLGTGISGTYILNPTALPLENVKDLYIGLYSGIALLEDGTYKVWGRNSQGQLGLPASTSSVRTPVTNPKLATMEKIIVKPYHYVGISVDGNAYGWGRNEAGQLGIGHTNIQYLPTPILLK